MIGGRSDIGRERALAVGRILRVMDVGDEFRNFIRGKLWNRVWVLRVVGQRQIRDGTCRCGC
jgi:hypothetical protein